MTKRMKHCERASEQQTLKEQNTSNSIRKRNCNVTMCYGPTIGNGDREIEIRCSNEYYAMCINDQNGAKEKAIANNGCLSMSSKSMYVLY